MPRSRTITVLSLLVGAMTLGTFALLAMETQPARPGDAVSLSARQAASTAGLADELFHTELPLRQGDDETAWRRIVIHDDRCTRRDAGPGHCHFVIVGGGPEDGAIYATERWRQQADGMHIGRDYATGSIGIWLSGYPTGRGPSARQMANLIALVRALQQRFGIGGDRVYLHGELTGSPCPGPAFPARAFRARVGTGQH